MDKLTLFPDLVYETYLNHASISPLNVRARDAVINLTRAYAAQGVKAWSIGNALRDEARTHLGRLIGADPAHIALLGNTSQGLSLVACEYPWQPGDGLVLFRGEFPGNILPWTYAAKRFDLKVHWLDLEDLADRTPRFHEVMAQRPKLMAVSWVQYQTGVTQDLEALSALRDSHGIHICLDAIQGLGPLTMDLADTPLDFVACGAHKWLLSPEGAAFLYVHPSRMAAMQPTVVSWVSQTDAASFLFRGKGYVDYDMPLKATARRYEMGTLNAVGLAGLAATMGLFMEIGPALISQRILALADRCRKGLADMGLPVVTRGAAAGNVCVPMDTDLLLACMQATDKAGVIVSTPDGHLRAAPHFYNTEADIDRYLDVVGGVISDRR